MASSIATAGAAHGARAASLAFPVAVAAVAAGIALRLVWGDDIEWKADEIWTFVQAHALCAGGAWPAVGMPTSLGAANPGLSLWLFVPLACVTESPPGLARAVALTNCAALLGFLAIARHLVPRADREVWLWAVAIHAVNPFVVLIERKIWPPSLLPLLMVLFLAGWLRRGGFAAAALWGAAGALMAQVHLVAGLLALAVAAWTAVRDRGVPWGRGWLAGSIVATLPALPWLWRLAAGGAGGTAPFRWRVPNLTWYLRWPLQPAGLGVDYFIGRRELLDLLAGPRLFGVPSGVLAAVHAVLLAVLVCALLRALAWWRRAPAPAALVLAGGPGSEAPLVAAAFWGVGLVLTLSMLDVHRHYLADLTIIPALWLARAAIADGAGRIAPMRRLLVVLVAAQAAVTLATLAHVHGTEAALSGDFGLPWPRQGRPLPGPPLP